MNSTSFSRRSSLIGAGSLAALPMTDWLAAVSALGEETGTPPEIDPFNRFPRMVHEYYVAKIRAVEKRALERKLNLANKEDAEAYVKDVQERIAKVFGPMPKKKSPLNAQVTATLDRDGYTVENVIFESRPKFFVTANLYLPKSGGKKVPGVIGTCGHSRGGKTAEAYQSFAQGLARLGTACLIYDPIGQGERSQYLEDDHELIYKSTTHEHNMAGNQMELVGEFLGTWRAWDGVRALDYLLTRPEIDPQHVGVTGNSGGGTLTTWLLGVEQRWTMGAPACFVSTWRRNLENELPQDNEQCPPGSLALGLDHDDYLAAMAPKPVIILAKEKDYFDVRGSEETFGRLQHLYGLLGAEENIQLHVGPTVHGYSQENREAMYRFFNSITEVSEAESEPDLEMEDEATLFCTPNGQAGPDLGSKTVFQFTEKKAEALEKRRTADPLKDEGLADAVRASLRMPDRDPESAPDYRILRAKGRRHYPRPYYNTFAVETEPRIQALCTMLGEERLFSRLPRASDGKGRAILWVADVSSDAELREEPLVREIIESEGEDVAVFACDVRGIGESLPGTTTNTDPHGYYGADYFYAAYANMLGKPYLGGKTFDVLRTLDWLAASGWNEIHLASKGRGTLPAGFAALLDDRVATVTLRDKLESWHSVATTEHYEWPLSHMIYGVLRKWDLPDVWAAIEGKQAAKPA
ncbi:MAG: prolyl oligopeptidase family serine peptidase [Verrucomicrobiales bacterium]